MKKKTLIKKIRSMGARYWAAGGKHDIYELNGHKLWIPRHSEIPEYTAEGIIKDAQKINEGMMK